MVSAAVHGAGPKGAKTFAALLDQLATIEPEQRAGYIDEVLPGGELDGDARAGADIKVSENDTGDRIEFGVRWAEWRSWRILCRSR